MAAHFTAILVFVLWDYKIAFTVLNFALCVFCAAVVGMRRAAVTLTCRRNPARVVTDEEPTRLADAPWPVYTVFVPFSREAAVAAGLLAGMAKLDYPHDKLDIKILVEEGDTETSGTLATNLAAAGFPAGSDRVM